MRFFGKVFNISDLVVDANLDRETLLDPFNSLIEEFDVSEFEVDDIEDLSQTYESLKFNFRKSTAIVEALRSSVRSLKRGVRKLKEEKETLSAEKDKIAEDGVKDLHDCQDEKLELHAII